MAQLTTALEDRTLVVTLTNPPDGTMDQGTTRELLELLPRLEQDPEIRCVIFTGGVDGVFVRHYSVKELGGMSEGLASAAAQEPAAQPAGEPSGPAEHALNQICRRLEALDKPVIAALNGMAMGGGLEFALACDIRIAQRGPAAFGLPEVHVGILPGAGGTQRLPRLIGTARALEMIMRGRVVGPDEALALGIVHEVADSALDRSRQIATELVMKPARALGHIKRLVRAARGPVDPALMELESRLFVDCLRDDEARRLMRAFNVGGGKLG